MALKYQDALKKGLHFGFSPERWLPVFILDTVFFALGFLLLPISLLPQIMAGFIPRTTLGEAIALFLSWILLRLYVAGALIHQSHKDHDVKRSWHVAFHRYPSLFGATLLIGVMTILVGFAPLLAPALALLVSVVCYFSFQAVVVKKRPTFKAVSESHWLFQKNFRSLHGDDPVFLFWIAGSVAMLMGLLYVSRFLPGVFVSWIVLTSTLFLLLYSRVARAWAALSLVGGAITVIFAFPLLLYPLLQGSVPIVQGQFIPSLIFFYSTNPQTMLPLIVIFFLGCSIATAFSLKAQTEFYHQLMKKRFWLI